MAALKRKFSYIDIIFLYAAQIFLIIICLSEINYIIDFDKIPHLLKFALPDDNYNTKLGKQFSGKAFLEESKKQHKRFITFYLTGDLKEDNKRFDLIRYETRKIEYTCDTMNILKVHFLPINTYGQFVCLINMMMEEQRKRYMYYKDDFYIIPDPRLDPSDGVIPKSLPNY